MTSQLDHAKTAVLALTRHQIRAVVQAAQCRDQAAMDVLEKSWDVASTMDPEMAAVAENVCAEGQSGDLGRFRGFQKDEEREVRQFMNGPAGRIPRLMTAGGALVLTAFVIGALLRLASLPMLFVAAAVSAGLVLGGGVMSVRAARDRFHHVFQNPAMACEHVWVAATDAALALALQSRNSLSEEQRSHIDKLTEIWTEAGISLEMLRMPAGYRLAA